MWSSSNTILRVGLGPKSFHEAPDTDTSWSRRVASSIDTTVIAF